MDGVSENIDDFIIVKADGYPTYNFAHIVDDHEMQISHVIRGDEFISSIPKFLLLHEALGFTPPRFAHVPPILAPTGNKKLSKRDGAGDIFDYRDRGYLPQTMLSFLATLGWNDGSEQEVFTREELIEKFDLSRVQKSGARYDEQRLVWLNGQFIRRLELDELAKEVTDYWPDAAASSDDDYRRQVLALVQERLKFFAELPELTEFFFSRPDYSQVELLDKQLAKKLDFDTAAHWLEITRERLQNNDFSHDSLEATLRALVDELDTKAGVLFKLLRIAVTGQHVAPGLFETMAALGHDEVSARIDAAKTTL
jgi:glutamyl-tRNA synthetase